MEEEEDRTQGTFAMHTQGLLHPGPQQHSLPLPSSSLGRPTPALASWTPIFPKSPGSQQCYWVLGAALLSVTVLMGPWGVPLASRSILQTYWQDSLHTSQGHFSFFFSILLGEYNCQNRSWIFSFLCKYCPLGARPRLTHTCVGLSQNVMGLKYNLWKTSGIAFRSREGWGSYSSSCIRRNIHVIRRSWLAPPFPEEWPREGPFISHDLSFLIYKMGLQYTVLANKSVTFFFYTVALVVLSCF